MTVLVTHDLNFIIKLSAGAGIPQSVWVQKTIAVKNIYRILELSKTYCYGRTTVF